MADDASQSSLSVQVRALMEHLQAVAVRVEEVAGEVTETRARVELEAERQAQRRARMGEILDTAGQPQPLTPRKPKRDRHGLHVVRGLGAAVVAVAGLHWRRAMTAAALMATVGAAGTVSTDMMAPAPAAQVPAAHHRHHREVHRHHADVPALPPGLPPRRKRRRQVTKEREEEAAPRPRASVSPSPSAVPSPEPSASPSPAPSPAADPSPVPSAACGHPGKHCHGGGEVKGEAPPGLSGIS